MKRKNMKTGFTLIEVTIATMIMAVMTVGLLSYVQFGSELWVRGERAITLNNTMRSVSESLARDLTLAGNVALPALGTTNSQLKYTIPIATGSYNGTVEITLTRGADKLLKRTAGGATGISLITSGAETTNKILKSRLEYTLARDVATFSATRVSSWSVVIDLGLESIKWDSGRQGPGVPTDSVQLEASYTFLIPGVK